MNLIGSAIGLVAPLLADKAGVGKNQFHPTDFQNSGLYSPNRFEYGGTAGGADAAANRYRAQADGAQVRRGEQVNYQQADQDRSMGLGARGGAQSMADLMAQRANGGQLVSQMQADRQMQQAQAAQASQAASARGSSGLALAQQNAANNVASMQGAISNQAQQNAIQEQMANQQAAYSAYAGLRGGDLATQQQDAQQQQYQSQLNAQQRAQNDQYDLGKSAQEIAVRNAQLGAGMHQQDLMAASHAQEQQLGAGISGTNANRDFDYYKMAIGAANGGAQAATQQGLAGPDGSAGTGAGGSGGVPPPGRATGGPVAAGQPYIVGEQGPELIVPGSAGTVIPNGPTMGLIGGGAPATLDRLNPDASMNVLGSLRAKSAAATRFQGDPSGGMARRGLY